MDDNTGDNRRQFVRLPKGYGVEINEFKFPIANQERFHSKSSQFRDALVLQCCDHGCQDFTDIDVRASCDQSGSG